ncbi:MAG: hypothetical protein KF708_04440 [Pirellulales bacterium]|nr:hypothetical protein [Pirellulales bacterium]
MNKVTLPLIAGLLIVAGLVPEALARGGRGGGGGAGMRAGGAHLGGAGGINHAAMNRSPSMSRLPAQRPQTLPARPNTGGMRPGNLPGNISTGLPGQIGTRPGQMPNFNNVQRPGQMPNWNGGQRPGQLPNLNTGQRPGQLPNFNTGQRPGQLPNFNAGQRPGQLPNVHPGQRPGGGTNIARPGGTTRPGGGNRPGISTLPGNLGPGSRPDLNRPGGRPSPGDLGDFLNIPGGITTLPARPGAGNRPDINRPGITRPDFNRPNDWTRPSGGRWEQLQNNLPGRWENRQEIANQVRNRWQNQFPNRNHWYNNHWWVNHPNLHWHYHPGFNYWNRPNWVALSAWMPYTWGTPIYYDFGTGGNVYYQDSTVYVDGQPAYSEDDYAQQASQIANSVPADLDSEQIEWMPLGVFAVVPDKEQSTDPTLFLQLAVSQDGIISGAFHNTLKDSAESVIGAVDRSTQRAAWHIEGQDLPVMETGIYNLTQDETTALVHFDEGVTQQWLLVRLNQPEGAENEAQSSQ